MLLAIVVVAWGCGGTGVSCGTGQINCDGICVNTMSDPSHCGACGNACASGEACVDGVCSTSCPEGQENCDGMCADTSSDRDNCGACGAACAAGEVCVDGTCATSCPEGQTECSGACVDTDTDRANCGACGTACSDGEVCVGGSCAISCPTGQTECSGVCVDLTSDRANCGTCGTACADGEVCDTSACVASCGTGLTDCSGACVDLDTDPANCGACGTACGSGAHGTVFCDAGTCDIACDAGYSFCSTSVTDGCTDLLTDDANCGTCSTACASYEMCVLGTCEYAGPTLTEITGATATQDTWLTSNPYADKHDGGWVYSKMMDGFYAIYGNNNTGRNVYLIDHIGHTAVQVATLVYNRHGSHPVIDEEGGYVYFPPSQYTNQLERISIPFHIRETRAVAPQSGTFAHGAWKNGKLWIVLNNNHLYSYDPIANSWTDEHTYTSRSMVQAHETDASDNVYVWVTDETFHAYDTVAGTSTALAGFPIAADLGGNGQIQYVPSSEGLEYGFIYAVSGCGGAPRIYSIFADTWNTLADPHNTGSCEGHATYDSLRHRLYVTDGADRVWWYQY